MILFVVIYHLVLYASTPLLYSRATYFVERSLRNPWVRASWVLTQSFFSTESYHSCSSGTCRNVNVTAISLIFRINSADSFLSNQMYGYSSYCDSLILAYTFYCCWTGASSCSSCILLSGLDMSAPANLVFEISLLEVKMNFLFESLSCFANSTRSSSGFGISAFVCSAYCCPLPRNTALIYGCASFPCSFLGAIDFGGLPAFLLGRKPLNIIGPDLVCAGSDSSYFFCATERFHSCRGVLSSLQRGIRATPWDLTFIHGILFGFRCLIISVIDLIVKSQTKFFFLTRLLTVDSIKLMTWFNWRFLLCLWRTYVT